MPEEILKLSEMQIDALREVGNVGAGNAATALSQIINRTIDMTVPRVTILPLESSRCSGWAGCYGCRRIFSRFWPSSW